jgi:hypothetical protein
MVIGTGFGHLPDILDLFNTVFLFSFDESKIKSKKIVFRENLDDLNFLIDVTAILIDRNQVHHLNSLLPLLTRCKPAVLIEGFEVIGRDLSLPLYSTGYRAVDQHGFYHVWKQH